MLVPVALSTISPVTVPDPAAAAAEDGDVAGDALPDITAGGVGDAAAGVDASPATAEEGAVVPGVGDAPESAPAGPKTSKLDVLRTPTTRVTNQLIVHP